MSQQQIDLWPKTFVASKGRPPVALLREQAALLKEKTGGRVQAEVKSSGSNTGSELDHRFYLLAPLLDNYRYRLFTIQYRLEQPYPLRLQVDTTWHDIASEEALVSALADVFKSERTIHVISALIDQSEATPVF